MADMLLTINHNGNVFSPPTKDDVQIEWDRTGTAGKMTFTVVKMPNGNMSFVEGDSVTFYYDDKPVFVGYVFTKKRDRQHHIKVTCYDQLRYFKNKYSYVFEKKSATQIIKALASDFNLNVGTMSDSKYIIPIVAEENISAFDIATNALEDTLLNTGNMFILYDNCGKLELKNALDMKVNQLIDAEGAENFNYSSSIDSETYNEIVLYYKEESGLYTPFSASHKDNIKQWGTLRYFEEVKDKAIAQNKAKALLKLYNRKTRSLTIKDAFGNTEVRAGCMIPVQLNLGDMIAKNYMQVEKVVHKFKLDHYTMDLTLEGGW